MTPGEWVNTTMFPPDGKDHYRQLPRYGNAHAVFEPGAEFGVQHIDLHNAVDFPKGTVNHLAKYAHERTGINEAFARAAIWGGGLYALYRLFSR